MLILSGYPEAHYATTLLRQGASGYLNKECDPEEIATAIRTVALGRRYITPAVAELLADQMTSTGERPPHEGLSERELQVFLRLAQGQTVGQMAEAMNLSVKTVSTYRTRVLGEAEAAHQQRLDLLRAEERPDPVNPAAAGGDSCRTRLLAPGGGQRDAVVDQRVDLPGLVEHAACSSASA